MRRVYSKNLYAKLLVYFRIAKIYCIFAGLRLHPLKSVNARVADVPWISLCGFRRIAGYATESKSDRQGTAARRMVFLIKSNFLNII